MKKVTVHHRRFRLEINGKRFYRILKLDNHQRKSPVSEIFKGSDYHDHLPKEEEIDWKCTYEIQRMRCVPGSHVLRQM